MLKKRRMRSASELVVHCLRTRCTRGIQTGLKIGSTYTGSSEYVESKVRVMVG